MSFEFNNSKSAPNYGLQMGLQQPPKEESTSLGGSGGAEALISQLQPKYQECMKSLQKAEIVIKQSVTLLSDPLLTKDQALKAKQKFPNEDLRFVDSGTGQFIEDIEKYKGDKLLVFDQKSKEFVVINEKRLTLPKPDPDSMWKGTHPNYTTHTTNFVKALAAKTELEKEKSALEGQAPGLAMTSSKVEVSASEAALRREQTELAGWDKTLHTAASQGQLGTEARYYLNQAYIAKYTDKTMFSYDDYKKFLTLAIISHNKASGIKPPTFPPNTPLFVQRQLSTLYAVSRQGILTQQHMKQEGHMCDDIRKKDQILASARAKGVNIPVLPRIPDFNASFMASNDSSVTIKDYVCLNYISHPSGIQPALHQSANGGLAVVAEREPKSEAEGREVPDKYQHEAEERAKALEKVVIAKAKGEVLSQPAPLSKELEKELSERMHQSLLFVVKPPLPSQGKITMTLHNIEGRSHSDEVAAPINSTGCAETTAKGAIPPESIAYVLVPEHLKGTVDNSCLGPNFKGKIIYVASTDYQFSYLKNPEISIKCPNYEGVLRDIMQEDQVPLLTHIMRCPTVRDLS